MSTRTARWTLLRAALVAALTLACATTGGQGASAPDGDADSLVMVDCLLPGTVRKMGRSLTYLTPPRPIKATARECEIRGGQYTAYDRASAASSLRVWLPPAKQGDARAQTYVGEIYEKGFGQQPDYEAAAVWYRKAAEQGYAPAQINLGQLYELGHGVPQDSTEALRWYRRASGLEEFVTATEVAGLKQELAERSEEVEGLRRMLERHQREVRALRADLAERQAEADAQQQALADARRRLEEARGADQQRARQADVVAREAEYRRQRREIEKLEADLASLREAAEKERRRVERKHEGDQIALAGPSIQMIDPKLAIARGGTTSVGVVRPTREFEVVGRVEAPAGLLSLLVNDLENPVDADGLFRTNLRVREEGTRVSVVAIDNQGKRATREFVVRPERLAAASSAAPPTLSAPPLPEPPVRPDVDFGRYYALVIGNNEYRAMPKLETAMSDARAVSELLENEYGFEVTSLYDATRYDVMAALNELRGKLTKKDNLLVYYAGHGELDRANSRGYWLPVDAEPDSSANWISTIQVTDVLNAMDARKVLVVADSCYSGALTSSAFARLDSGKDEQERLAWLRTMVGKRSRTALTSGGLSPVPDSNGGRSHSVFAKAFIEVLIDNEDVLPAQRLYQEIAARVTYESRTSPIQQSPEYAPIRYSGHESGDFFFVPGG